jgi:hypothetical protein
VTNAHVFVAIPSHDRVLTDFMLSLLALVISNNQKIRMSIVNKKSCYVDYNRNQLVSAALKSPATHLLFIDTDMIVPPDSLPRLINHNKDIVAATYVGRSEPHFPMGITYGDELTFPEVGGLTTGLRRMKRMPTGLMLVKMEVFRMIPPPWFQNRYNSLQITGEDYSFCDDANSNGFEVWCDQDLSKEVRHICSTPLPTMEMIRT